MGPAAGRPDGSVLHEFFLHSAERPASAERLREGLGIMARPFCRNAGTIRKLDNSMDWLILVAAGCMETIWAVLLKYTHGFTRFWPTAATLAAMAVSFWLLALALKTLPMGTAYVVWTGIGAVGVVVVGILCFGEAATWPRLASMALILAGIAGLKFFSA